MMTRSTTTESATTESATTESATTESDGVESKPGPRSTEHLISMIRRAAGVLTLVFLGAFFHGSLIAPLLHERQSSMLEERLASALLNGVAPVNEPIEPGTPIGLLEIPSVGVRAVVAEGSSAGQLSKSAGHLRGSALPGQYGVSAVLGRSESFGAEFARLDEVEPGDEVVATTGLGAIRYRVVDTTVRASDDAAAFVGEGNMLILVTVTNGDDRLVVRAEAVDPIVVVGTESQHVNTSAELGLEGEPGSGTRLLGWLLVAVVASVLQPLVAGKLGRRVAWTLFFPVFAWVAVEAWTALALMAPAAL